MGVTVARICQGNGYVVHWASENRSSNSKERAQQFGFVDCVTITELALVCDIIISVVANDGAVMDFVDKLVKSNFAGVYIDANTLHTELSRIELYKRILQSKFHMVEMAIRGFIVEDVRTEYPELNKLFIEKNDESFLRPILSHPDWEIRIVEMGTAKQIVRDLDAVTKANDINLPDKR